MAVGATPPTAESVTVGATSSRADSMVLGGISLEVESEVARAAALEAVASLAAEKILAEALIKEAGSASEILVASLDELLASQLQTLERRTYVSAFCD